MKMNNIQIIQYFNRICRPRWRFDNSLSVNSQLYRFCSNDSQNSDSPEDASNKDDSSTIEIPKPRQKKKALAELFQENSMKDSTAKSVLISLLETKSSSDKSEVKRDISDMFDGLSIETAETKKVMRNNDMRNNDMRNNDIDKSSIFGQMIESKEEYFSPSHDEITQRDIDDVMKPEIILAVDQVAESMGEESAPGVAFDLLNQLLKQRNVTEKKKHVKSKMSDIMSGITVQPKITSKEDSQLPSEEYGLQMPTKPTFKRSLFSEPPLGIFTKEDLEKPNNEPVTLFDIIEAEEMKKSVRFPPRNSFEEMIQWTEEGKLWRFPIDNEQDIGDESNVPFHKHVFLDNHLKKFDSSGPVKHFMELVINGLSKNPYMTVDEKEEHIDWYVEYFKEKRTYLDEYNRALQEEKQRLTLEASS